MRALPLILFMLTAYFAASDGYGQELRNIYIQSENRNAFYVKVDGRIYPSSTGGYAVVGGLPAGERELGIGFSSDSWSIFTFFCKLNENDLAFMLRKDKEGWQLFNIHNGAVIPSGNRKAAEPEYMDDGFVNVLAEVAGIPSLKEKNPAALPKKDLAERVDSLRMGEPDGRSRHCMKPSSAKDFRALRRRLRGEFDEMKMISLARAALAEKCFTALQIKYLAGRFENEAMRFGFVEAAYDFVYDPLNYGLLKDLFSEPVFLKRFAVN